jgi:hypothetical protein
MPVKRNCKETLQQVRERLVREQRLRTEQRIRDLLEPEQLAVTEDELVCQKIGRASKIRLVSIPVPH